MRSEEQRRASARGRKSLVIREIDRALEGFFRDDRWQEVRDEVKANLSEDLLELFTARYERGENFLVTTDSQFMSTTGYYENLQKIRLYALAKAIERRLMSAEDMRGFLLIY